eukprot:TRINITY_DN1288_c0_g1_i1.p1 TRINITY_DN1288_c0_g1~~TRINITY_DN1288_c0_g1_i1.p1  ORF type:complete len:120 (+),score=4.75 TRINITY_DN1288_c0_g1_i1:370-729(+)
MAAITPVIAARVIFTCLSVAMAFCVIYTCVTDGTPFRSEVLTPWMGATLIDFYLNVFILLCWLFYKEDGWLARIIWTALFIGLGSIMTCLYLAVEFFKLNASDPLYLVIFKERHASKGF